MRFMQKFYIGAIIFLLMGLFAVTIETCFNIDRRTIGGLIRPSNTAVYRPHLTINESGRWQEGIVYYGEKGKILQRDIISGTHTLVGESRVYSTGANGEQLCSETVDYSLGIDRKNRIDPITYQCYTYYESGALFCKGYSVIEKIDGKYLLDGATIRYTYFNEEGEETFDETVPFDPLAVDNYLLQHLLQELPFSEYDPYPEFKKISFDDRFPFGDFPFQ